MQGHASPVSSGTLKAPVHYGALGHASAVIDLSDVHKVYKSGMLEVEAVRGVTTTIEDGEFVAVTGPSGSGKSTLMHIIGCLDVPSSGTYRLAGDDVSNMSEMELARIRNRRIGFVFQQYNLLPTMTAWRNVELPLTYAAVDRTERRQRAMAALERVGITGHAQHRPGEMSGGQQQRVAVARALVADPDLILCDEPTGALDTAAASEVLSLLEELHASGRTVVVITHEPDVAARAQRILRMRDGQFVDDERIQPGSPK
jgi:putative ABC transport system ATP-binding protein